MPSQKTDVVYGTLALMILKTLGPCMDTDWRAASSRLAASSWQ